MDTDRSSIVFANLFTLIRVIRGPFGCSALAPLPANHANQRELRIHVIHPKEFKAVQEMETTLARLGFRPISLCATEAKLGLITMSFEIQAPWREVSGSHNGFRSCPGLR